MSDHDTFAPSATGPSSVIPFPPRRRSFVATPQPAPALEAAPQDDEDDIPLLTEVVDLPPPAAPATAAPDLAVQGQQLEASLADTLAAELAHAIEARLAAELPSLVEATLAGLQDDLKRGIVAATESALKDFIARRQTSAQ